MQEIEIKPDYDQGLLSFKGYSLLVEKNVVKSRTGMFIKDGIKFTRRNELEGIDSGLVIVDLELSSKVRIIGVYRVFNPHGQISQHAFYFL